MKKVFSALSVLLLYISVHGQGIHSQSLIEFYKEFRTSQFIGELHKAEDNIQGSPHEQSEFIPGIVQTIARIRYEEIPLRFNIYSNQMEFKTEDGIVLVIATPEVIDHVIIDESKYIYGPYNLGGRLMRGYFKVISEGNAMLLLKQNVTFKQGELPQAYKDAVPPRFVRTSDELFIRILPSEAHKITNKKELLNVFQDKRKEIEGYLSKNRVRFNRVEDMKAVTEYYNSL